MTAPLFVLFLAHFVLIPQPLALVQAASQSTATEATLSGVVRDSAGGVVTGALVIIRTASGGERRTVTASDGRFTVPAPATGALAVIIRAEGFAEFRQDVAASAPRANLEITLETAGISETVTVTPTRTEQRLGDLPAAVSVISQSEIHRTPAMVPDDVLRQLPQFSLFRRSSSISAHPTSQGVSLRGIGPSGVSRSLVLVDGIPFNDAFGGWVYWTALPLEGAERIDVVDGASSSLYGTYAMGGVINVVTRQPTRRTFDLATQYGSRSTPKFDFRASDVWGKVGVSVEGSAFDTDGYANVLASQRGAVDTKVLVQFKNFGVKLDYAPTDRVHTFLRTGYFREERKNGKLTTVGPPVDENNDTTWTYVNGGARVRLADASDLQATVFTDFKTFRSNFLAIPDAATTRNLGRLSLNQEVPTDAYGGMVQWSKALAAKNVFTAGTDFRWVDGDSIEDAFDATTGSTKTTHRVAGGTQKTLGVFLQDVITPSTNLTITLSARYDRWRNYDAHNTVTTLSTGAVVDPVLADKKDSVTSPRVGVLYRFTNSVSIWGDLASGFRAPTLNELYRQFSQGQVVTQANPALGPERLKGGEFGVNVLPVRNLTWRTTYFDNRVKDPVANVTITPPNLLQRQNLGRTRIWGIQTDVDYRVGLFRVAGAYIYDHARVTENSANPALVGTTLAQVPSHRGSFQLDYSNPRYVNVTFDVQINGQQFDDDLNTVSRILPKYTLVNLNVSRAIKQHVEVFVGAQNLLNDEYWVGTASDAAGKAVSPTLIGAPRTATGGFRIRWQGR